MALMANDDIDLVNMEEIAFDREDYRAVMARSLLSRKSPN